MYVLNLDAYTKIKFELDSECNSEQLRMYNQLRAVKIIETRSKSEDPKSEKIVVKINQWMNGPSLEKILCNDDVKNLPVLVFSITGRTRGGKSFLLNLIARYLESQCDPNWSKDPIEPVFECSDGVKSCTRGLWICPKVYKLKNKNGKEVGIILMDNEGLFDGEITDEESITMCGVSTLVSQVQMFNMDKTITADELTHIMCFLVPDGHKSTEHHLSNGPTGGQLMFIVRDFKGGADIGFGLENGRAYVKSEKNRGTEEHKTTWSHICTLFEEIECLPLPNPGDEIDTFTEHKDLSKLKEIFVQEVHKFLGTLFSPENLIPRNEDLTGSKLYDVISENDGKICSKSHSYFSMLLEQNNQNTVQEKVQIFKDTWQKQENSLPKARSLMDKIVTETKFMGSSVAVYETKLKKEIQKIINFEAVDFIVNDYKKALKKDIVASHKAKWPESMTQLKEWAMGTEEEKNEVKQTVVEKTSQIYYDRIASEEKEIFKKLCKKAKPVEFHGIVAGLDTPAKLHYNSENKIKICTDFQISDINQEFLHPIILKCRDDLKKDVQSTIKRNQFKLKDYIVQLYKDDIGSSNIARRNRELWPYIEVQMNKLECDSESERDQLRRDIVREVATEYYDRLRKELVSNFQKDCKSMSKEDFHDNVFKKFENEQGLDAYLSQHFPCYQAFSQEAESIWHKARDYLKAKIQYAVFQELMRRGYMTEAKTFWEQICDFVLQILGLRWLFS